MQSTSTFSTKFFKGFTLIELLVVIAIIGLLSTIIAAPIQNARKKSRDAKKISELKGVQSAIEQYAENNSSNYPVHMDLLYPNYLPTLSQYVASTSGGTVQDRDKFGYVTYRISPVTPGGVDQIAGYHLGVHLEAYNIGLDNDADCFGTTSILSPTAGACFKVDPTVYKSYASNTTPLLTTNFSSSTSGLAGDFGGMDRGTSTCSAVGDCVYDVTNQQ